MFSFLRGSTFSEGTHSASQVCKFKRSWLLEASRAPVTAWKSFTEAREVQPLKITQLQRLDATDRYRLFSPRPN